MDASATSWLLPALSGESFIITQTCQLALQPMMGGTQPGAGVVLPHHAGSLPQQAWLVLLMPSHFPHLGY